MPPKHSCAVSLDSARVILGNISRALQKESSPEVWLNLWENLDRLLPNLEKIERECGVDLSKEKILVDDAILCGRHCPGTRSIANKFFWEQKIIEKVKSKAKENKSCSCAVSFVDLMSNVDEFLDALDRGKEREALVLVKSIEKGLHNVEAKCGIDLLKEKRKFEKVVATKDPKYLGKMLLELSSDISEKLE